VERVENERAALERLGPAAARAGAAVPVGKACPHRWMLASNPLPGRSAAAVLTNAPRSLLSVTSAVANWLTRWNIATASTAVASTAMLEALVMGPLDRLVSDGVAPEPYARAVATLAESLQGQSLVVVAAHRDLTMANVLVGGALPGILDWESAIVAGLPLSDLWYALADGVARAGRVSHASAVEGLVTGGMAAPAAVARLPGEHATTLGLRVEEATLAFHVCWLGHADDELRRGGADRPFADVLRTIAARRLLWPQAA
jgi:hypothetical protein